MGLRKFSSGNPSPASAAAARCSISYPPRCSKALWSLPSSFRVCSSAVSPLLRRASISSSCFWIAGSSPDAVITYSMSGCSSLKKPSCWRKIPIRAFSGLMISPLSGLISPQIMEKTVVLPAPFGPTKPIRSPLLIRKSASLRISRPPRSLLTFLKSIISQEAIRFL